MSLRLAKLNLKKHLKLWRIHVKTVRNYIEGEEEKVKTNQTSLKCP